MCFNREMTLFFTLAAAGLGGWVMSGKGIWKYLAHWQRVRCAACYWWFSFMEFIQFIQYLVIDDCDNMINMIFTALGWLHICFQPVFSNLALSGLDPKNQKKEREETWGFVLKLTITMGVLMAARMVIPWIVGGHVNNSFTDMCNDPMFEGVCGEKTCSTTGNHHVAWHFLMYKPSYPFPNVAAHFIGMFVIPFLLGQRVASIVLFMTGPFIAALFKAGSGEQSAIWCFFSIGECSMTILTQLYLNYRNGKVKAE